MEGRVFSGIDWLRQSGSIGVEDGRVFLIQRQRPPTKTCDFYDLYETLAEDFALQCYSFMLPFHAVTEHVYRSCPSLNSSTCSWQRNNDA